MGRGVALLRFVSLAPSARMPRRAVTSESLRTWLEDQLQTRGVDPKLYSRYIISLLQLDNEDFEPDEAETRNRGRKASLRLVDTSEMSPVPVPCFAGEERKKLAAVRCLQSACLDPYEVDVLIDELCYRLQRLKLPEPPQTASAQVPAPGDDSYLSAFPPLSQPPAVTESLDNLEEDDDVLSVCSSEGSDILNLVNQILLSFNTELSEGMPPEAPESAGAVWSAVQDKLWGLEDKRQLEEHLEFYCDDEAALSDHDFDEGHDVSEFEEQPKSQAKSGSMWLSNLTCDQSYNDNGSGSDWSPELTVVNELSEDDDSDDEGKTKVTNNKEAVDLACSQAAAANEDKDQKTSQPKKSVRLTATTAQVTLSEEEVVKRMEEWGPLDVVRHELWSRAPRPPVIPNRTQRACSFLLRGHCKKDDCEFAHDLTTVTCKFWSAGECFKGRTCPFLHGYVEADV